MGDMSKVVGGVVAGTVVILGLTWVFQGNDFFLYKTFAPKQEAVRREVFEQSKAYNQGMIQELENMMFEYQKATPAQKDGLRSIILHRAADYDDSKLPPYLAQFISQLRQEERNAR